MMMPYTDKKISDITDYRFTARDKLFFDTNVWLSIFRGLQERYEKEGFSYAKALRRIRSANAVIYTNDLILSEFINSRSRSEYNEKHGKKSKHNKQYKKYPDFKSFRASRDFRKIARDIAEDVRQILSDCQLISSGISMAEYGELVEEYATGKHDFNDQVIARSCRANGLTLITHDGDFAGADIRILTANRKMLRRQ